MLDDSDAGGHDAMIARALADGQHGPLLPVGCHPDIMLASR
jgi:hypothetical protein